MKTRITRVFIIPYALAVKLVYRLIVGAFPHYPDAVRNRQELRHATRTG